MSVALIFELILFGFFIFPQSFGDERNIKNSKPNIKPVDKFKVLFLEANTTFNFKPSKRGFFEKHLNTYCYSGEPKTLRRLLETIELQLEIEGDDYIQYEGNSPAEVEEHYLENRYIFNLNLFAQKRTRLSLTPFMQHCIGVETIFPYNVTLYRDEVDFYRSIQLLGGVMMFLCAGILSTNSIFYYITGILLGICSSFMLIIWLSGKLMPKRTVMYGVLIGGWTVGFYIVRMLWENIQMIMMTYRSYVYYYIITTGIISFFLCYRWGPPRNRRSKNIIKWLLQLMSSAMIYFSSNFKEACLAIIFMTAVLYYFPPVLKKIMTLRRTSKELFIKKKDYDSSSSVKQLGDDCQQWQVNSQHYNGWKIKPKPRPSLIINSRLEQRFFPMEQPAAKYQQGVDEYHSGSEQDFIKQKLYPLPDGSFILSEKPPIIIPRKITPVYHSSTPAICNIEHNEGDYTPKKYYSHKLAVHSGHCLKSVAASTSDLLIDGSHAMPSTSELQRLNSFRRIRSRSDRMITLARKDYGDDLFDWTGNGLSQLSNFTKTRDRK